MKPEQALQILDQAAQMAPLTRRDHINVVEAVSVLQELLKPKEEPKPKSSKV
jgi:hypothetical protein